MDTDLLCELHFLKGELSFELIHLASGHSQLLQAIAKPVNLPIKLIVLVCQNFSVKVDQLQERLWCGVVEPLVVLGVHFGHVVDRLVDVGHELADALLVGLRNGALHLHELH